jgi:dTDP-L-rhamnose 4-epimerase
MTIAQTLLRHLGGSSSIGVSGQFRIGDIRHNVANLEKVKRILGFEPKVGIEDGLSAFVDWVKGEQISGDRYEESLNELRAKGLFK